MSVRAILPRLSMVAAAAVILLLAAAPVRAESTWDHIKRTGELRYGAIDYPPNSFRDKKTGKWEGFQVDIAEDIAKELGVKAVPVETTWATCVLDLEADKIDMQGGLQATPKRAMAIDFAGPAYKIYWYAINHKGFKAKDWADYNKPEVKIAAMRGSADVTILQKVAPKATRVELQDIASVALAVTSGRADAMVTAAFGALVAKNKNPDLGEFVLPRPVVYLPSYIGVRREYPNDFRRFLQYWAEWNDLLGYTDARVRKWLKAAGATNIPENVRF